MIFTTPLANNSNKNSTTVSSPTMEFSHLPPKSSVLKKKRDLAFTILYTQQQIENTFSKGKLVIHEVLYVLLLELLDIQTLPAIRLSQQGDEVYSADNRRLWLMNMLGLYWIQRLRTSDEEITSKLHALKRRKKDKELDKVVVKGPYCRICKEIVGRIGPLSYEGGKRLIQHISADHIGLPTPPTALNCQQHGCVFPWFYIPKTIMSSGEGTDLQLGVSCLCKAFVTLNIHEEAQKEDGSRRSKNGIQTPVIQFLSLKDWVPYIPKLQKVLSGSTEDYMEAEDYAPGVSGDLHEENEPNKDSEKEVLMDCEANVDLRSATALDGGYDGDDVATSAAAVDYYYNESEAASGSVADACPTAQRGTIDQGLTSPNDLNFLTTGVDINRFLKAQGRGDTEMDV